MDTSIHQKAQILRDYMLMWHQLQYCDVAIVWWSVDLSVPTYVAGLYHRWLIGKIIFSGGVGRNTDGVFEKSEAEMYADIAIFLWVPSDVIILEKESTNTWANIINSMNIVFDNWISHELIMLVHKPYMERRFYAAFEARFPALVDRVTVTSMNISIDEYSARDDTYEYEDLIHMLVWDIQRIINYPKEWFQSHQHMSDEVLQAYTELLQEWYTHYL